MYYTSDITLWHRLELILEAICRTLLHRTKQKRDLPAVQQYNTIPRLDTSLLQVPEAYQPCDPPSASQKSQQDTSRGTSSLPQPVTAQKS